MKNEKILVGLICLALIATFFNSFNVHRLKDDISGFSAEVSLMTVASTTLVNTAYQFDEDVVVSNLTVKANLIIRSNLNALALSTFPYTEMQEYSVLGNARLNVYTGSLFRTGTNNGGGMGSLTTNQNIRATYVGGMLGRTSSGLRFDKPAAFDNNLVRSFAWTGTTTNGVGIGIGRGSIIANNSADKTWTVSDLTGRIPATTNDYIVIPCVMWQGPPPTTADFATFAVLKLNQNTFQIVLHKTWSTASDLMYEFIVIAR